MPDKDMPYRAADNEDECGPDDEEAGEFDEEDEDE
jgi:hypothetical protein